jgi:transmembrane 9 superfamily protein 2/4
VTTVFALLGFLSPSNRGSLATVMMVCWTFFGSVGGYVSARLYASLGGTDKRRNSFVTATALPTWVFHSKFKVYLRSRTRQEADEKMIMMSRVIFAIVFFLNLFLISAGSSGAVPFG